MQCLSLFSTGYKHIPFSKTPSEKRPGEVRVSADSFSTLFRAARQALCYKSTRLPAARPHQDYCSIRFKSSGSLRPVSAPQDFSPRLSTATQMADHLVKKTNSDEFGLVGWG